MVRLGREEDQVEGQDEEFLYHLNLGSELLTRGDAEGARSTLERALGTSVPLRAPGNSSGLPSAESG